MKFRRRRRIEDNRSSSNTGMMMNLSLFIMLLAFFIVLNSISTYEEIKTAKVKRSVELAFSSIQQEDVNPSVTPDPVKSINDGDAFERLELLFQSQIVSFEMSKSKSQGVMMVKVPYAKFSEAMLAVGQEDLTKTPSRIKSRGNFFLPTLVSLLKTKIEGTATRMEIYLHVKDNPAKVQNQSPRELNKVIGDLGVFSALLEKRGAPQKLLNIGISEGDPEFVDLVFRRYVPFSPVEVKK